MRGRRSQRRASLRAGSMLFVTGLVCAAPFLFADGAFSQGTEPSGHSRDSGEVGSPDEDTLTGRVEIPFEYSGYAEFRALVHAITEQDASSTVKKNELKANLDIKYGNDDLYLKAVVNLYSSASLISSRLDDSYAYSRKTEIRRNFSVSSEGAETGFRELFINLKLANTRLRAGNQIFGWGTADVFNPTSYFTPYDLREVLFRADDELRQAVPSLSAMFFIGDSTLELVVVPVHIPMLLPPEGNFWEISYREGPFPVRIEEPEGLSPGLSNAALGARYATSIAGMDMAASIYRGPDREPLFRPMRTVLVPNEPVSILVRPEYHPVTMAGLDFSMNFDRVVIQAETVYSPDRAGVVEQDYTPQVRFPFEVRTGHYVSYSAGFNYFVPLGLLLEGHEGETVLTVEWNQSRYFDGGIMAPLITDVLAVRLQDEFLGGRLKTSITFLWDARADATVVWPSLGWDFGNGLSLELACASISARERKERSIFSFYDDNDIVTARARYAF